MNIDIDPNLIGPTLTGTKRPVKDVGTIMSIIFNYVKDIQNQKQEKEITRLTVEARDEFEMPEVISEARVVASDEARAEDWFNMPEEAEARDELTQLYEDEGNVSSHPAAFIARPPSPSLNLDRGRLETIAVARCHGDILSPMSIFFENPALANLEPLMKNARLIVSGGFPGLTVVSQGIGGPNSRFGGCLEAHKKAKTNCSDGFLNTNAGFNAIVDVAKGYGGLNKEVNFDDLIKAKVNPDDILGDYNQTNLVHCLYFSADPEGARLKIKQVSNITGNTNINNTVNEWDSETENAMMKILDPYYKADDFSACDIISVTDQTQDITLIYNNETDIFDINNLGCYSKLKYFFTEDLLKKDDADKIMRPFVLKLQLWVHKFVTEWNRLIFYYVENKQELYGDIRFLLKLENLVVVMDIKKNTITYSNTFVQNILIMGFGKWLFGVYQYLQNQEQNKKFMTEFMSIFDSSSINSNNSNNSNEDDKYVNFCKKISNLLGNTENPQNIVKVIGNFCQVYNKRVYPPDDNTLTDYINTQQRLIKTLWVKAGTKTLAEYEANQEKKLNNYKPASKDQEAEVTTEDNINNTTEKRPYASVNSNPYQGNPYQENISSNSNSYSYSGRGGKPKSKKQRRQSKKQRRQSKKQRRQSKKQRRQGNKRNKYTVKRRR